MTIYKVYRVAETGGRVVGLDGFLLKERAMDYARDLVETFLDPEYYYVVSKETIPTEAILSYEPEEGD